MSRYRLEIDGTPLEMWFSDWTGMERISWAGEVVSEKRSWGVVKHHEVPASVTGGAPLDIRLAGPMGYVVRREGQIIAERHRPGFRWLIAFGLVAVCFGALESLVENVAELLGRTWPGLPVGSDVVFFTLLLLSVPMSLWLKRVVVGRDTASPPAAPADALAGR